MALSFFIGATVYSGYSQRKMAKKSAAEMRKLGIANEKMIKEEGAEDYRRSDKSFKQIIGKSEAIVAGSGIGGASKTQYLKGLETESEKQLDWINKSTASRAKIAKEQGYAQANRTERAGDAALMNSITSAFGMYTMSQSSSSNSLPDGITKRKTL